MRQHRPASSPVAAGDESSELSSVNQLDSVTPTTPTSGVTSGSEGPEFSPTLTDLEEMDQLETPASRAVQCLGRGRGLGQFSPQQALPYARGRAHYVRGGGQTEHESTSCSPELGKRYAFQSHCSHSLDIPRYHRISQDIQP